MIFFITAIGTDSGKTVVSAIFAEALQADYWKPIQAGHPTDTEAIKSLVSNLQTTCHKEAYLLSMPASPHAAAKLEGIEIDLASIKLPKLKNNLIIEGAGGVMVPINNEKYVIEIAKNIDCDIILVCNLYLGSINHSLLSISYLKSHGYKLAGIVFNGEPNKESESIILQYAQVPCLLRVEQEVEIDKDRIAHYANILKQNLTNERIIK